MLGQLFAFGTLAAWSVADLVAKHAVSKLSTLQLVFWGQFLGGAGILVLGFLTGYISEISLNSLSWILLLAALNVGGMILFYEAIRHKGVALSLPITYSWSVPTVLFAFLFLNQLPSTLQLAGIAAVVVGLFLVAIEAGSKRWVDRGSIAAFFSMITWGVFYFLLSTPAEAYGEWWVSGGIKLCTGLLVLPILLPKVSLSSKEPLKRLWPIGLIGLCDAVGLILMSNALQMASGAVVTGITSTTPAVVATAGILFYKEKVNRQQIVGITVTVAGLLLLVL